MPKPPAPARKIRKSAVKNICRFATAKSETSRSVLTESILEKDFCYYLEFSNRVQMYAPQPETLSLVLSDGSTHDFTPDFKAQFVGNRLIYAEIKPAHMASDGYYKQLFTAAQQALAARGIGFQVFTEEFIRREPLLSNMKRLHRYRKEHFFNKSELYRVAKYISEPISLKMLIKFLDGRNTLHEIYSWLAFGYLKFDIEAEVLTIDTEVVFHVE